MFPLEELPPAVAVFVADVNRYTEPLREAIKATEQFRDRTDAAAVNAREMSLQAQLAGDRAAASMRNAEAAAEKYARGEAGAETAARAAAEAQRDQERASIALARAQQAVKDATDANDRSQRRLASSSENAASKGFAEAGMLQKIWTVAGFATGSLEPLAAGIIAVTGGLASGLASAGLGLGAFAVIARSALTQAATAAQAAQQAQTAYGNAVARAGLTERQALARATSAKARQAAVTAHANALQSAALTRTQALAAAYQDMSAQQVRLSKTISGVQDTWHKFVAANTAGVARIVNQGIGLLPRVFAMMQPLLAPTEKALSGLIGGLGRAVAPAQHLTKAMQEMRLHMPGSAGPAGAGWLAQFTQVMSRNAGPAITKLGTAVGNVAHGVAALLETFAPFAQVVLSGLDQMTAGFEKWATGLRKTQGFAEFMTMVKTQGPAITGVLKNLGAVAVQFVKDMGGSASNMLWLKVVPQVSALAAAFAKANPGLIKFAMNVALVAGTGKQLIGWGKSGVSAVTSLASGVKGGVKGLKDFAAGFGDADKAASEATGKWGTFGGAVKKGFSAIGAAASGSWSFIAGLPGMIGAAVTAVRGWAVWSKVAAGATKVWAGIQAAFNLVMDANPVVLVVLAVAALAAGVIYAYTHFKAFRDVVDTVGRALKAGFLDALHAVEAAVRAVISFVRGHWQLLVGIIGGPVAAVVMLLAGHWRQILSGAQHVVSAVVSFFAGLPHRILSALGDLGSLLLGAGKAVVEGLIHGMESMAGSAVSFVQNLGSSLLHGAMHVLGISSPSKEFARLGAMITAGLASGIQATAQQAVEESRRLAAMITAAAMAGEVTASQEASLRRRLSSALATAMKGSVLYALQGSRSQIRQASAQLLRGVAAGYGAGLIGAGRESALTAMISADNTRLQKLAAQRDAIAKRIAAAKAYAAGVTSAAESAYSLSSAAGTGAAPASVASIVATLRGDVTRIRRFKANLQKLAREGLNKAYLDQLVQMGPDQGGALAAELAAANLSQIRAVNAAESQVAAASRSLGQTAAESMFDSGKAAGKGFLAGLKAQEAQIEAVMRKIAQSMVKAVKRELGISSPSRVMMLHGMAVAEGLARGIEAGERRVTAAARGLASAVAMPAVQPGVLGGGAGGAIVINLRSEVTGKVDNRVLWQAQQSETFRYNIRNSGVGAVTGAWRPGG